MKKTEHVIHDEASRRRIVHVLDSIAIVKPILVTVQHKANQRSKSQNALMWKWVSEAAEEVGLHTGYDKDDMHEFFKDKFAPSCCRKLVTIGGHTRERITTTTMTTAEMTTYMSDIDRWCVSELGVILPHPDDVHLR